MREAAPFPAASEHGKTFADSKGDIQRGLEVVEFACGIPHLLKGEFSDSAGPGIDLFSLRQPLGVVAGITPFNFPAMIPMWKFAPALACGNAFILKPSERDPSVPMRLAELLVEAGLPAGVLNVVNGDKEAVDTLLTDPRISAIGFVGSSASNIYSTGCAHGKRVQCLRREEPHGYWTPTWTRPSTRSSARATARPASAMAIRWRYRWPEDCGPAGGEAIPRVESLKVTE